MISNKTADEVLKILKADLGLPTALSVVTRLSAVAGSSSYRDSVNYLRRELEREYRVIAREVRAKFTKRRSLI